VNIKDSNNDASTNAKNVFTYNLGTMKPANFIPLNAKELIEMLGTKTVRRYRIITFIKKENDPKVIRFKGRVMIFKTGFIIKNIKDKTTPPMIYVGIPPEIFTPGKIRVKIKSAKA